MDSWNCEMACFRVYVSWIGLGMVFVTAVGVALLGVSSLWFVVARLVRCYSGVG